MRINLAVTWRTERSRPLGRIVAALSVALILLAPVRADAQVAADSVGRWTRAIQTGTLAARDSALTRLAALPAGALPSETRRILVAELNRVHQAILSGGAIGVPGEDEELVGDYYMELVGVVSGFGTKEAALALAPAVTVSGGVARRVARYGDAAVTVLMPLLERRYNEDDVLAALGLVWFWADSTGSPLSDRSRAQIIAALTAAAGSGVHRDMLGLQGALEEIHDPAFLPFARQVRDFAATRGVLGRSTVATMEDDVIPHLTALASSRSPASLANGLARMVTAVCATDAPGRRHGACESIANGVGAASNHVANGRVTPARNGFESVGRKIDKAYADGAFSAAEHALLGGNVAMVLQRLTP
ncbi:MAG: hypothetical protein ACYC3L_07405 [Gemmatimonadaceae bacterium]